MGKKNKKKKYENEIIIATEWPSFINEAEINAGFNYDDSIETFIPFDKNKIHTSTKQTDTSPVKGDCSSNQHKEANAENNEFTSEKNSAEKNNGNKLTIYELAKIFSYQNDFVIMDDCLFYGNRHYGYYVLINDVQAEKLIRKNTPQKYKYMINRGSVREVIEWLKSFDHLQVDSEKITRNKFHINFKNGVLDVLNNEFLSPSLEYCFTSYIDADYPDNYIVDGHNFEKFMNQVVKGDVDLYKRIQEVFGYVISEIRDIKQIIYFVGKKDSGKSIMLNLLEQLVGKDSCSHVSLSDFTSPFSLARLHKKKLNTCGETAELTLSRLDLIKAATGNDPLTGEHKYQNQFEFTNQAAMIFAGNDLPNTKGLDKMNAFIDRLLIIPFDHQVPKKFQDINLLEKLIDEKSYISKWAIEGLVRLIRNNYIFTNSDKANEYLEEYLQGENSFDDFLEYYCEMNPSKRIHSWFLREEYEKYCAEIDTLPISEKVFHKKLQRIKGVRHERFRLDGENRKGYVGLGIKELGQL